MPLLCPARRRASRPHHVREGGGVIAWPAWEMPTSQFGTFVAGIPVPPGIGKLELADESVMNGFVREGY